MPHFRRLSSVLADKTVNFAGLREAPKAWRLALFPPLRMRQSAHMTVYSLRPQINSGESQPPQPPRLMDQIRAAIRTKHYSPRTEEAYLHWARQFILFHDKRHPLEMGEVEVGSFLEHLAVDKAVAASTQNQALNALVFLYGTVLRKPFGQLRDLIRAKRPKRSVSPLPWTSYLSCSTSWTRSPQRRLPTNPHSSWPRALVAEEHRRRAGSRASGSVSDRNRPSSTESVRLACPDTTASRAVISPSPSA